MWEIIAQALVTLILGTIFFILNLRVWAFHKKGLDPIRGLKKTDISAAKALDLERQREDIINHG